MPLPGSAIDGSTEASVGMGVDAAAALADPSTTLPPAGGEPARPVAASAPTAPASAPQRIATIADRLRKHR